MSLRYRRLLDLLNRDEGVGSEEGARELGVSKATYRGMLRDLRKVVPLKRVQMADRRFATYRLAGNGQA